MPRRSAGLLMYRRFEGHLEVLLVHPGGPFWMKKDRGAWTIPKGECAAGEELRAAATREFQEETGLVASGPFRALTPLKQPGGKIVHAWAFEGNCDAGAITSNSFPMEWPRGSGRMQEFPEVDRAGWFRIEDARQKILSGQAGFLDEIASGLA